MSLPTPNTRKEQYLNAIATGNSGGLPTPITREEEYLEAIAKSGGGGSGDGDMKKSVYDSDLAVANAGGIGAFVDDAISGKVDKVEGKGLSTNDYDNTEKGKVADNTGAIEATQDMISDAYDNTHTYNVGDYCIHENTLYKCNTASTTGTWDSSKWDVVTVADELGELTDAVSGKVDKVAGKGLSTNDYDNTEKGKVADNTAAIEAIENVLGAKNQFALAYNLGTTGLSTVDDELKNTLTDTVSSFVLHLKGIKNDDTQDFLFGDVISSTGNYEYTVTITSNYKSLFFKHNGTTRDLGIYIPAVATGRWILSFNVVGYNPSVVGGLEITEIMLRPAGTDPTYVPYAMTNRELTDRTERSVEYSGALDNLLKPGFYITAAGVTNTPNDSDFHFINNGLFVSGNGANYCSQMIIDTRNQLFSRICNNGTWTTWAGYTKA